MKKQTQLLSALALSVGLTLSAPFPAVASIPGQVPGQAALPSLAPMLEKVLPAVVSVGSKAPPLRGRKSRKSSKSFLVMNFPINLHNLLKDWVQVSLLMPPKATS